MLGIGIYSQFGYSLPFEERLRLIKDAGFDATVLWWHGDDKHSQPDVTRKIGLQIDNVHAHFCNPDCLWRDGIDGGDYYNMLISCIEDCSIHNISTAVIHLTSFEKDVEVTYLGLNRVARIIDFAQKKGVKLAFENTAFIKHLDAVFGCCPSPNVGFCWDSGHENLWHPDKDCLELYGDRLFALHINDNFGDGDSHILPFDGTVDWNSKIQKLKNCKDVKYFTLEVDFNRNHEKCKIYDGLSAREYLASAYKKASKLIRMLRD